MAVLDLVPVRQALSFALEGLRDNVEANAEVRDLNASGKTMRSITTRAQDVGGVAVTGDLSADEQWRFMGNGRKPGKAPPISAIQAWIDARGLDLSAWAIALTIQKEGTGAYRRKERNVFEQSIESWLQTGLDPVEDAAARTVLSGSSEIIIKGITQ